VNGAVKSREQQISVTEADQLLARHQSGFGTIACPLGDARGRVLREEVCADREHPPFDRVTMDGIAIDWDTWCKGTRAFRIDGAQHAGDPVSRMSRPDVAIEVMTGAVLPEGSDCVIPVEEIEVSGDIATVCDGYDVSRMRYVHAAGSDHPAGHVLLREGSILNAPHVAIAASCGKATLQVSKKPSVAVVSTGDELVAVKETPEPHQIRRSNVHGVMAALAARLGIEAKSFHMPDDEVSLRDTLADMLACFDVLILSGGVSMGKADFVPKVLADLAVRKVFHKVSQRPGKPMYFGLSSNDKPVFGLPGNPVSTLVTLHRYVLPWLERAQGMAGEAVKERASLSRAHQFAPALTQFLPVCVTSGEDGTLQAEPAPTNTSGDYGALAETDGFIELPAEQSEFQAGYSAPLYRWS
jgi:molybdopterin molybdotransferase